MVIDIKIAVRDSPLWTVAAIRFVSSLKRSRWAGVDHGWICCCCGKAARWAVSVLVGRRSRRRAMGVVTAGCGGGAAPGGESACAGAQRVRFASIRGAAVAALRRCGAAIGII